MNFRKFSGVSGSNKNFHGNRMTGRAAKLKSLKESDILEIMKIPSLGTLGIGLTLLLALLAELYRFHALERRNVTGKR